MDDRQEKQSIIGRDADAARDARATNGQDVADQLNANTSEAAGGNVSGSDERRAGLDIVFEREDPDQ